MVNIFDFFIDFTVNISKLFTWLFFETFSLTIDGQTYRLIPIGLLVGVIGISIGIIRRIL